MLKNLFKLITLSTILSLIFITVSCKYVDKLSHHSDHQKEDNQQISEKILLDGIIILDRFYFSKDEPTTWYKFSKNTNTIEISDHNKYRTISATMKISNVTYIETSGQYVIQTKLNSLTCTLTDEELVKVINNGNFNDKDEEKYDLDLPENIKGWKLNEKKDIIGAVSEINKSATYQLKVSEDKKTINLRHVLYDGTLSDDSETFTILQ